MVVLLDMTDSHIVETVHFDVFKVIILWISP